MCTREGFARDGLVAGSLCAQLAVCQGLSLKLISQG
jgi:hypothetical protein